MIGISGIIRVQEVGTPVNLGKAWVLEMKISSKEKLFDGNMRTDIYDAHMYIPNEQDVKNWQEQIHKGTILYLKYAQLEGINPQTGKGWIKVRLLNDTRFTVVVPS